MLEFVFTYGDIITISSNFYPTFVHSVDSVTIKIIFFSYSGIQKSKQKGIQKAPNSESYMNSLCMSETTNATNYSIRSNLHQLAVQYQNKLALNPFDVKRMYLNPIKSLPWDKHTQNGDCSCILGIKFIGLCWRQSSAGKESRFGTCWLRNKT